jgi:hypothetical protein
LGGLLGYNQIVSPISISNHNIEHKAEFDIFSNSRLSDENNITLRQGINRFFEKGGVSGVLIFNDRTRAIFKTNLNTKEVYGVFDSHECLPNKTAVVYYFNELNDLIAKMEELGELREKPNEKIEFDIYSVKFNIVLEQINNEIEIEINEEIPIEIDKEIEENDECVPYDVKSAVKRFIKKRGIEHTKPLKLEENACRNCGEQKSKDKRSHLTYCIIYKVCIPNLVPIVNFRILVPACGYKFECECGRRYVRPFLIKSHEKICPFNNAYVREYFLNGGKIISRPENFVCPNCMHPFFQDRQLKVHLNRKKIKNSNNYLCNKFRYLFCKICGKNFTNKEDLEKHLKKAQEKYIGNNIKCICNKPNDEIMISCNKCKCIYHPKCVHLSIVKAKYLIFTKKLWICPKCDKAEDRKKLNELKLTMPKIIII